MHKTNLRKVGGSVMLAVPPAVLELLNLHPGARVALAVQHGRLVVEPQSKPQYTLDQLLAECNPTARRGRVENEWLNSRQVGAELV